MGQGLGMAWIPTATMGAVFFSSLVMQVFILGEWYLATVEFFLLSILQLGLCAIAAFRRKGRAA